MYSVIMNVDTIMIIPVCMFAMIICHGGYDSDYDSDHGEDFIAITLRTMIFLNIAHLVL